ncbi:MAG: hypothetical protein ACR2QK_18560 [Acidimicrobiales bacterium]
MVTFAVLLGLVAAACGSSNTELAAGQAESALNGQYATLGGGSIDLADLQGQDVVLWFWAPW